MKLEHTYIIQHMTGMEPAFDFTMQSDDIDLDAVVDLLVNNDTQNDNGANSGDQ